MIDFDIPSERADRALTAFAKQAGVTLVFPFDLVSRTKANALVGRFGIAEGLDVLLKGTGLNGVARGSSQIMIEKAEATGGANTVNKRHEGLLGTIIAVLSGNATAQTGPAATRPDAPAAAVLEEVIVTARQRKESLQDIPLAIAAFSANDIDEAGFRDLGDIALQIPGVDFSTTFSNFLPGRYNSVVKMRGVQVGSALPHLQPAALFVDGVYALEGANSLPITDLERVEVIKGPQSAFFGRNTFAGAINYITKKPNLEDHAGRVSLMGATYDSYEVNLTDTGPIIRDKLGYLANVRLSNKGPQWTATDGGKLGEQTSKSISLALYAEPTDNIQVKLRAFYQRDADGPPSSAFLSGRRLDTCSGQTIQGLNASGQSVTLTPRNYFCGTVPNPGDPGAPSVTSNTNLTPALWATVRPRLDGALGTPVSSTNYLIEQALDSKYIPGVPSIDGFSLERELKRFSLNADWQFSEGYTATLTAGYNESKANWLYDLDQTDVENYYGVDPRIGDDQSVELRVSSPANERLRWLAGATYYQQEFITSGAGGLVLVSCFTNCGIGPVRLALPTTSGDKASVRAVYGALSYDITEKLTLDLEYRYMEDKRTNTQNAGVVRDFTTTFYQKTPRVILSFRPLDGLTVYGQVSKGTLPGVINGNVLVCSDESFLRPFVAAAGTPNAGQLSTASECEQIRQQSANGALVTNSPEQYLEAIELGVKGQFAGGAGRVGVAAYDYVWKGRPNGAVARVFRDDNNPQLRDRIPGLVPVTLGYSIPGAVKARGLEVDGDYAFNSNWSVGGNVAWSKNENTDVLVGGGYATTVYGSNNYSDKEAIRTPSLEGGLFVTYKNPLSGSWNLYTRADLSYYGKTYVDFGNLAETSAYSLVHARLGLERNDLRLELFVRNLFDQDNWSNGTQSTDNSFLTDLSLQSSGILLVPQDKRQVGLRVSLSF